MPVSSFHRRIVFASTFAVGLCPHAWAEEVLVFTDAQHHLTSTGGVRVVELDAPLCIEAALSGGLPPDAGQAAAIVQQRLAQNPDFHEHLRTAYQGALDAYSLGITKIPAVVVDRRYVVYGEHDVGAALALIAAYRGSAR